MPSGPDQLSGSVSQPAMTAFMRGAPVARSHGVSSRVSTRMMASKSEGEHDAGDDADDERVEEVAVEAVAEEQPELGDADDRGDADDAHVAHRGDPQAGRDDRHGEGQLDGEEPPAAGVAHRGRGLLDVVGHRAEPVGDGAHEQGHGVERQARRRR